jgi:hypothetical protein
VQVRLSGALSMAMHFMNAGAELVYTRHGAQHSLPVWMQIDALRDDARASAAVRRGPMRDGRDTMDEEQQQQPSEESREESALLKLQEEFHQFLQECRDCRHEIASHWQFCAHCGLRLATHCPGCGNPLPPLGAHACARCGLALPQVSP